VINQLHEYFKVSVISERCCRASYGITYDEPYDKLLHAKSARIKHPNGHYYVHGNIHWLIDKNEFVNSTNPPRQKFSRSLSYKDRDKWLHHRIVKFIGLKDRPDTMGQGGVSKVCSIHCNLGPAFQNQGFQPEGVRLQHKHRLGFLKTGRFLEVDYEILVHFGPADLRFDLLFDGEKRNKKEEIEINWKTERKVVAVERASDSEESGELDED
jgi:hypothetical protein